MNEIDRRLSHLESRIVEAEGLLRTLHQENVRLREALAARSAEETAGEGEAQGARTSIRIVALEAERNEVRSRLRTLIEAIESR